ncbi:MAG: M6 family metalloprotease domain-containing protein [Oligoflexia bacterium]|nr:M6 family metalloprotease domain-containing protein [Oligoflexia bacterium]
MKIFILVFAVIICLSSTSIGSTVPTTGTWLGNQRALVLLLEWADKPSNHTRQVVDDTFFKLQAPSLRQYFVENSTGKFDITGDVLEWKRSTLKWNAQRGCEPNFIAQEGWKQFSNLINMKDYDSNNDGKVDHLFIVHTGRIPHDRVGPSCMFGRLSQAEHTIVFQSEGVGSIGGALPIGFFLHEAGHELFGFPDLYNDHYHGRYGIGMWGMMGLGAWGTTNTIKQENLFRYPSHFEPYSKIQIGWVKPQIINKTQLGLKLRPVETSGDVIAIPLGYGTNYYLEYRSKQGFSTDHRGHGLLIWNNYKIIQADGRDDINSGTNLGHRPLPPISENFGDESDPFPGALKITKFVDAKRGISVENIVQYNDRIEFNVTITNAGMQQERVAPTTYKKRFNLNHL